MSCENSVWPEFTAPPPIGKNRVIYRRFLKCVQIDTKEKWHQLIE